MARESGLTVSALRFYDGAGVLTPASVDPDTGYRYYRPDQVRVARLVAALRRVGMPLATIREVLAARDDPATADALLDEHLRRLELGLADARRELSRVRSLIVQEDPVPPTTVTVRGPQFADAVRAVRFAVGSDPELPVLGGVLLDIDRTMVALVATDRYRLAFAMAGVVALDGPPVAAVVPAELVDRIGGAATVTLTVDGPTITVRDSDDVFDGELIADAFPDYRRLLPTERPRRVLVDDAFRAAVAAAPTRTVRREPDGAECEVISLGYVTDDRITADAGDEGIGVDREFLLEALEAPGDGELVLSLDGPISPLVIWSVSERSVSLLMPVRL
ncbi:MAG: MerR family transcriptional regulator [Pseudonocardia sp.]